MSGSHDMKPASPRMKLTYDDYLLFPDDGKRHELIDGEHYVTPTPILRHQAIAGRLHLLIASYLKAQPIGRVFFAPLDVILSRFDVVEPDLLYVSRDRCADLLKDWVRGAPDLVVEIGSPSTRRRDETIKRTLYEREGVIEYWIVDPEIDVVRVYRRSGDRFERPVELSHAAGDVLTTALLPGLELPLGEIFDD
jgi:Uma2 family endonuclease